METNITNIINVRDILFLILNFFSFNESKHLRLINKLWNESVISWWRHKRIVFKILKACETISLGKRHPMEMRMSGPSDFYFFLPNESFEFFKKYDIGIFYIFFPIPKYLKMIVSHSKEIHYDESLSREPIYNFQDFCWGITNYEKEILKQCPKVIYYH